MLRHTSKLVATVLVSVGTALAAPTASAQPSNLFVLRAEGGGVTEIGRSNNVVDLVEGFIETDPGLGFGGLSGQPTYSGTLDYLGVPNALVATVTNFGTNLSLAIPSLGQIVQFSATDPTELAAQLEEWVQVTGATTWADFLREMNGATPLAVLSGNPKSTVALMGDSAYRKFGFDDSRSRMGWGETITRWGGFELRIDAGVSNVNTAQFSDDLWTIDPSLTLAGDFGRHVGLSFSIVGQYRDYEGAQLADLGLELALPITFWRPDRGPYFWQLTPFVQAGGGISLDFAAGGLFLGGGVVNALGWNRGAFEVLMSNQIAYYGGLPIDEIGGYDFKTSLSQLYFKNGLEGTWWIGAGFYADAGVHFTNFAVDKAAVPWFATPTVGVGWQAGRWVDLRIAYEADLSSDEYVSNNLQLKLDFLF